MNRKKLTHKQDLFCQEYIIDFNATQSYIRAGYSAKSETVAGVEAHKLLKNPKIQEKITQLKQVIEEKLSISAEWVLNEAIELYEIAKGKRPHISSRFIDGKAVAMEVYKTNLKEAVRALEVIGRHTSVKAFDKEIDLGTGTIITVLPPQEFK
jgi:phage terminase small subunit